MLLINTHVRIDLSWYIETYPDVAQAAYNAGHGMTGYISNSIVDIDGDVRYWVTLDKNGVEVGGFGERDLEVV